MRDNADVLLVERLPYDDAAQSMGAGGELLGHHVVRDGAGAAELGAGNATIRTDAGIR